MTKHRFTVHRFAHVAFIPLVLVLSMAMFACGDSEPADESVAPTVETVAPTETPETVPTDTPAPPQDTPVPTQPASGSPPETPTPTEVPAATAAPTAEPTSVPEPSPDIYPLEIRDMMGRPVIIAAKPTRIVSISPTATEMLYIAGGTAIARDSSSTFPSEVQTLPDVGGAYSPSFETIAAQRADLILIEALTQARFVEPLSQFGAPVVAVRATSLDDVATGILLIGQIIDNNDAAEEAAENISTRVSSSVESAEAGGSVLILISDADRNLYAAKPQSYPGAIASMFQLSNPAADLPDSGTFPGFALVSAEQVLGMDPDYLFTITPAPEPVPRLSTVLPRIPGFSTLSSISSGRIHELDHVIFLRNQGPRIAEAAEAMAELVGASQ